MAPTVLITAHHRSALAEACLRGFWMPIPLSEQEAMGLAYLVVLQPGQRRIQLLGQVCGVEPWQEKNGLMLWLPFLSPQRRRLRHPIPLGDSPLLRGWLPKGASEQRLLPIDPLLLAGSLAEALSQHFQVQVAERPVRDLGA
jgi:hypothetical protein